MFKLQEYELDWLLECADKAYKQEWEMTRFQSYINLQMNSKKKLKLTDVIKFGWDKEQQEQEQNITSDEIERLRNKAEAISKNIRR